MNMTVISPATFEAGHYEAVCRLLRQLTTRDVALSREAYEQLVCSSNSKLFLMLGGDGAVMGMLTVGMYASPTGTKAWIEDVVVEAALRGGGLGRALVEHAIGYCREVGIDTVYLTSNPKRVAANALYQSVGFGRKETNMYKMDLKQ